MGRDQAVRQHKHDFRRYRRNPLQVRQSGSEPTRQKSVKRESNQLARLQWSGLVRFFRHYPLALLLVAWIVLLLMAGVAIMDMTSLSASKPQVSQAVPIAVASNLPQSAEIPTEIAPTPTAPAPASVPQPGHNSLPLFSLVAIALSCALGCMIILQSLKPRHRPPERSRSSVFSKPASQKPKASAPKTASRIQQNAQIKTEPAQPKQAQNAQIQGGSSIVPSIVPPSISQPLDWEEPSLADHLDLRQKRPLSHWL